MTCAIRLHSMPVKDTLLYFAFGGGYLSVICTPVNGSVAAVTVEHNVRSSGKVETIHTGFQLALNEWYLLCIQSTGSQFILSVANGSAAAPIVIHSDRKLFSATWTPGSEPCAVLLGTKGLTGWPSMYGTSTFQYDVAWVHFFQQYINASDMARDTSANWIYTSFPNAEGHYEADTSM